jgi:hypothetical protein
MRELGKLSPSEFHSAIPGVQTFVLALDGLGHVLGGTSLAAYNYWDPTRVIPEMTRDGILNLKKESKGDFAILGSGSIVQQVARLGLIDEYQLMVNPVILGKGKYLFQDVGRLDLAPEAVAAALGKPGQMILVDNERTENLYSNCMLKD